MSTAIQEAAAKVSVNALAAPRVAELIAAASRLRLGVMASERGATIVDAGIAVRGGLEAGRRIAEICMGGLGSVQLASGDGELAWLTAGSGPQRRSGDRLPRAASTRAGASRTAKARARFTRLPPDRAAHRASRSRCFDELGYTDRFDRAVFVLEVDRVPPRADRDKIARDCALAAGALTVILTPTNEPRGCRADRRARARGGAAQGARARLPAAIASSTARALRPCRRRRPIS